MRNAVGSLLCVICVKLFSDGGERRVFSDTPVAPVPQWIGAMQTLNQAAYGELDPLVAAAASRRQRRFLFYCEIVQVFSRR